MFTCAEAFSLHPDVGCSTSRARETRVCAGHLGAEPTLCQVRGAEMRGALPGAGASPGLPSFVGAKGGCGGNQCRQGVRIGTCRREAQDPCLGLRAGSPALKRAVVLRSQECVQGPLRCPTIFMVIPGRICLFLLLLPDHLVCDAQRCECSNRCENPAVARTNGDLQRLQTFPLFQLFLL